VLVDEPEVHLVEDPLVAGLGIEEDDLAAPEEDLGAQAGLGGERDLEPQLGRDQAERLQPLLGRPRSAP